MNKNTMKEEIINEIVLALKNIKEKTPLVYHLTNTVYISDKEDKKSILGSNDRMI